MRLTKKYPGLVDRYYTMKPDKEFLVPNGSELQNGTIVLLAQDVLRWPIENRQESDFVNFSDVLKTNRWCRVNDVKTDGYAVHFVGIYPDGTVARRSYPKDVAWLAKKDDMPEVSVHEKIAEIVKEVFEEHEKLVSQHDYPAEEIEAHVKRTIARLMGVVT